MMTRMDRLIATTARKVRNRAVGPDEDNMLRSVNGGRTTHLAVTAPTSGPGGVIAVPPGRPG
jgi:hypothetical protein